MRALIAEEHEGMIEKRIAEIGQADSREKGKGAAADLQTDIGHKKFQRSERGKW